MCRIVGFIDKNNEYNKQKILVNMRDTMVSGGPDDAGEYIDDFVALGHRRLSIIELSKLGHQPMTSEDEDYIITYNGEVYNHDEIRQELIKNGHNFKSHSDTEVILKSFIQWKEKCLDKFHGMFAFAIYSKKEKTLFLARDRVGVKPLYFYKTTKIFLFSSEIKAFHKHPSFEKKLSYEGLSQYLKYSYIPAPYTIFEDCYKLEAGHYMYVDLETLEIEKKCYWNPQSFYDMPKLDISYEEAIEKLEEILTKSFERRMVSDVPVGMFLSGGIDSSTLLALLSKDKNREIKTFTIGFEENEFNEAVFAKEYAKHLGTEHHEHYLSKQDALDIIPKLPDIWDEPFADASQIPTYLVSRFTKEHVTVSLSADGGDELFFGYPKYWLTKDREKTIKKYRGIFAISSLLSDDILVHLGNKLNIGDKLLKTKQLLKKEGSIYANAFDIGQHIYSEHYQDKMFNKKFEKDIENNFKQFDNANTLDEEKMLLVDFKTYLPDDILTKVDRATMAVSLEGREPFLDQDIFEFVARLPFEYKYKDGVTKRILREILYKYIPKEMVERPKMGFGIPLETWCREDERLSKIVKKQLSKERIEKDGIFNYEVIGGELERYFNGEKISFNKIWTLFMFQMWYERWM
ncbi:asparagine synthase (glutamine-hydrolyzing) [Aliarcobacter cryaerophilus]|uniref:asparagine synthase (glutamine-hydrolyzing) n=1 Tax=Aliarcobacter cryaerophilus TaxID=28198 RepID=UPI00164C50C3|nr:asparagine synthase (glutamine-hydrolyzing) [Aliarcobacter cryaerophilus]QNK84309.1 asparagine synthase (glutamine-hydrolyzing) [Aliarcobacter cryaerophilus]